MAYLRWHSQSFPKVASNEARMAEGGVGFSSGGIFYGISIIDGVSTQRDERRRSGLRVESWGSRSIPFLLICKHLE
jgi:hypothetical protein